MFDKKKKKDGEKKPDKKSIDRKKATTVVPRSAFIEERLKRIKAEKMIDQKKDMPTKDITELLDDMSDLDKSSDSDSDSSSSNSHDSSSESDSSSSSSDSSSSEKKLSSLNKKIKKLQKKQVKQKKEIESKWITEAEKIENTRWKKKELWVDQELYTKHKANRREIMEVGGPSAWVQRLFMEVNSGMKVQENLVWKMVTKFAVVMFLKDVDRDAVKSSEIIEGVRHKHNIDEDEILEVVLDDSHAAKMTFIDLQRLTNKRNFPQIFVNETFIGGLKELKDLAAKSLLLRQILIFQGIVDRKCEKCISLKDHRKMGNASRNTESTRNRYYF